MIRRGLKKLSLLVIFALVLWLLLMAYKTDFGMAGREGESTFNIRRHA